MVAVMIVVGDEPLDAGVEITWQEVVLQQDAVLEVLMPSFDTPLGRGSFEIDLTGDIVNMIEFAESGTQTEKAASKEAAIPDVYRSSVKVVAGARSLLFRTQVSAYLPIK